jgi:hypothetical protein
VWLPAEESSTVKPDDMGAMAAPPALQHNHQELAFFLIKVQMQKRQILVLVSGHS